METFLTWMYAVSLVLWGLSYSYTSFKKMGPSMAKETADAVEAQSGERMDHKKLERFQDIYTIIIMFIPVVNTMMFVVGFVIGIQRARAKEKKS